MEFKKLQAPSIKDLFIKEIEYKILSGELQIGEQLPTERDLADKMGINRNIVHSGIVIMVAKGFLEIRPRIGTFVADYNKNGSVEILVSMMNYNGGMLRKQEIRSSIELKILFDCFAIEHMKNELTREKLDNLWSYVEALEKAKSVIEAAEISYEFFRYMSIYSGNTILPLIYNAFRTSNTNLFQRHIKLYGIDVTYQFVQKLFLYIANGETEEAIKYLTEYYNRSLNGNMQIYNY